MQYKDSRDKLIKALDASIAKTASKILADALEKPPLNQMSSDEQCKEVQRRAEEMKSVLGRLQMPDAYKPAREILTKSTGFMDAYDFTLNPYSGCSFGCTYCYAAFFSCDVGKRDSWGK